MLVSPIAMMCEGEVLEQMGLNPWARTMVSRDCPVVTPFHGAANRLREWYRGAGRHGSCGMGIGETRSDMEQGFQLRIGDLQKGCRDALYEVQRRKREEIETLFMGGLDGLMSSGRGLSQPPMWDWADVLVNEDHVDATYNEYRRFMQLVALENDGVIGAPGIDRIIFEGAQGVLIDERFGFHPHTTWTNTTADNAISLANTLGIPRSDLAIWGVTRAYMARHGAGPLPTEDPMLAGAFPEVHNLRNDWQGPMRKGWPDLVLLAYAGRALRAKLDGLVVTHLDQWSGPDAWPWPVCHRYESEIDLFRGISLQSDPNSLLIREFVGRQLTQAVPLYMQTTGYQILALLEAVLNTTVELVSVGPTAREKLHPVGLVR